MEVRRSEAADARGKTPSAADLERLFMGAIEDRHRPYRRLPPMPGVVPPPPPPSKCVTHLDNASILLQATPADRLCVRALASWTAFCCQAILCLGKM